MIRSTENQREKTIQPFCQATGCFDHADVYIVLKETEEADYYEVSQDSGYGVESKKEEVVAFDGFKLILYLCGRHDNDFRYLVHGSELRIAKRCDLHSR